MPFNFEIGDDDMSISIVTLPIPEQYRSVIKTIALTSDGQILIKWGELSMVEVTIDSPLGHLTINPITLSSLTIHATPISELPGI